ncbi:MAG TPA: glycine zipper domain-containing protein [Phycisphaerales bacterium]|nr:glycine zipper domain-containing protein [Phycisphaerales bacterium]
MLRASESRIRGQFIKIFSIPLALFACGMFSGCADHAQGGMALGAGFGAMLGAIAGNQSGRAAEGAGIGAGVGAVTGYIIGNEQDKAEARYSQPRRPSYQRYHGSYNPNCDY